MRRPGNEATGHTLELMPARASMQPEFKAPHCVLFGMVACLYSCTFEVIVDDVLINDDIMFNISESMNLVCVALAIPSKQCKFQFLATLTFQMCCLGKNNTLYYGLVLVPDPNQPQRRSLPHVISILEAIRAGVGLGLGPRLIMARSSKLNIC